MPRVCYFTGKKTSFGKKVTHRGKAKYLGGVGTKITGISSRKFRPNMCASKRPQTPNATSPKI